MHPRALVLPMLTACTVAVLLGSLILHEAFGLREILGMTIILAAVALVQLRQTPTTGKLPSES